MEDDTIVAISTPPGRAAIGVIRVSGPSSLSIAEGMAGLDIANQAEAQLPQTSRALKDRRATVAKLRDAQGLELDEAVVMPFFGPRSYTGEDLVEITCHGNPLVLDRVVERALGMGARAARPGEFTLRAFLNGRIDLTQAEAVLDLIEAKSEAGLSLALRQLEGELRGRVEPIRSELLDLLAHMTAVVEFSEEDIPAVAAEEATSVLAAAGERIDGLLAGSREGQVLLHGVSLAIVGAPNAGKSSILNRLLKRERAIVTPIPGTTRDTIEEEATIGGVLFRLMDTAGMSESEDTVEVIGIQRSRAALAEADLILVVIDASKALTEGDRAVLSEVRAVARSHSRGTLAALNKSDLPATLSERDIMTLAGEGEPRFCVVETSAVAEDGLEALRHILPTLALGGPSPDGFVLSNRRHIQALHNSRDAIASALTGLQEKVPLDLISLDVRGAVDSLDAVLGTDIGEDVLNRIFSRFCIGK